MINFKTFKLNYKLIFLFLLFTLFISFCVKYFSSFAFAQSKSGIPVTIIMYHSLLKSKSGDYIVHPETFENDLKYIKENGYTTITMSDLIDYVYNDSPIPEKSIIITFDDGHYNNLLYAIPLLEKYNMKAVISIVGSYTDNYSESDEVNANYSYLRWKDINNLLNSNNSIIEFQNHSYDLHSYNSERKGCKKLLNESLIDYTKVLSSDICKLQEKFFINCDNYTPNTFTYPLGAVSLSSVNIIKSLGFKASLSCSSGVNYITKDTECLYLLKRNNRVSGISTEKFFSNILK